MRPFLEWYSNYNVSTFSPLRADPYRRLKYRHTGVHIFFALASKPSEPQKSILRKVRKQFLHGIAGSHLLCPFFAASGTHAHSLTIQGYCYIKVLIMVRAALAHQGEDRTWFFFCCTSS